MTPRPSATCTASALGEARREFDLGDLRDRSRFVLPVLAGVGGMVAPVLIYLAFNAGGEGSHGWGVAMSRTPRWRSACSRWWDVASRTAFGCSC